MRITADDRLLLVLNQTLAVVMVQKFYTELFIVDVVVVVRGGGGGGGGGGGE